MGAGNVLASQVVERSGEAFGHLAAVDEEDGGVALANEFEEARMNGIPDGDAARRLRSGAAGDLFHHVEARHIFNRNFNSEFQLFAPAGVDDGHRTVAESGEIEAAGCPFVLTGRVGNRVWRRGGYIDAAEEARDFFE